MNFLGSDCGLPTTRSTNQKSNLETITGFGFFFSFSFFVIELLFSLWSINTVCFIIFLVLSSNSSLRPRLPASVLAAASVALASRGPAAVSLFRGRNVCVAGLNRSLEQEEGGGVVFRM